MINVFLCYGGEHENIAKDIIMHLKSKSFIHVNYDKDIDSGTKWDGWIKNMIKKSEVLIVLLSKEYLSKDYVKSNEIQYIKSVKDHASICPILINNCLWNHYDVFKEHEIYPDKGKALLDYAVNERDQLIKEFSDQIVKRCSEIKEVKTDPKKSEDSSIVFSEDLKRNIKKLGVIVIQVGKAVSEELTENVVLFYKFVAESVIGDDDCEFIQQQEIKTLAVNLVDEGSESSSGFTIPQKIIEYYDNSIKNEGGVDILVIDYCSFYNDETPPSERFILYALKELLSKDKSLKIVNVLPDVWVKNDAYRDEIMKDSISDGRFILLDKKGKLIINNESEEVPDRNQYFLKRDHAFEDSLKMLQTKMIRRIGHFAGTNREGVEYCYNFLYNGDECEKEIYDLIKSYIHERYKVDDLLVVYSLQMSDWLKVPINSLRDDPGIPVVACESNEYNDLNEYQKSINNVLIVLPFYQTGDTAKKIIYHLEKYSFKKITVLSIIKDDDTEQENIYTDLIYNGKKYQVFSFIGRKRGQIKKNNCVLCEIDIGYDDMGNDIYHMLTSHSMWSMANEYPWKDEDKGEVTPKRKPLRYIPDFYSIIHSNGAWLSNKIRGVLDDYILEKDGVYHYPQKPCLILCPNEKGANALADHLNVIQGYNVVAIPKDLINSIIDNSWNDLEFKKEMISHEGSTWYSQLKTASKDIYSFVLEEFCVRGRTKEALIKIAQYFGICPYCHIALFNFNPPDIKTGVDDPHPTKSLYEFQINPEEYSIA